jgi:hypothetical protein
MNSSNINIRLEVEKILNTKPPANLGEYGNSVFYTFSILGLINKYVHTLEGYVKVLDDVSSVLKQDKYKRKLVLYSKRELRLVLIKFCFRESFFSRENTKRLFDKFMANTTTYEITVEELARQFFAIHPYLSKDQVKKKKPEIDEVMFMLVASFYDSIFSKDYWNYLIENFYELLPVFRHYGLNEFGEGSEHGNVRLLLGSQRFLLIDSWFNEDSEPVIKMVGIKGLASVLIADYNDNLKGVGLNEDGTEYFDRTPKQRREDERRKQFDRGLQTISNLSGGIFAVIGFAIGGDKGSDLGAIGDAAGGAWLQARMGQQQYEDIGKSLLTNNKSQSAIYQALSPKKLANLRSTEPQIPEPKQIPAQFPRQVNNSQNLVTNNPRGISTPVSPADRNISSPVNNDSRATSSKGLSSNSNPTSTNTRDQDSVYRVADYDNLQKKVIINGVKTNSYFNDFLLGNDPEVFMSQASKVANASSLGTYSKVLINGKFRSSYGTKESDWRRDGRIMEGGHARSKNLGGKEFVVLMSAKYNRKFAGDIEHPSTGGAMAIDEAYIIDKIAIHKSTALDLVSQGHLDASAVQNARVISFELIGFPTRPNLLQFPRRQVDMSQNLVQRGIFDPTQPTDK